jgi:hypothetical protein
MIPPVDVVRLPDRPKLSTHRYRRDLCMRETAKERSSSCLIPVNDRIVSNLFSNVERRRVGG